MSIIVNQHPRKGIRLESWQQQPASRDPGAISEMEILWMVAITRIDDSECPTFELEFLKSGESTFTWSIPSAAYAGMGNVFLHGGSFLRETMKHMGDAWMGSKDASPHFYALYEQEAVQQGLSDAGVSFSASKWLRL